MDALHVTVLLTNGDAAIVDRADAGLVSNQRWTLYAGKSGLKYARASGRYSATLSLMHRLISGAKLGEHVDHINGNGLDNRRSNLRVCTHAENMGNRRKQKNSAQPFKGVRKRTEKPTPNPWRACIGKEQKYLGCFATAEEAARAYDSAAVERYGAFAKLNFQD